jgi:alanyl-tRNA synthetase
MQFERSPDGSMAPLPRPSIDTGLGLERLAAVTQKVRSNFETDLFQPLLAKASSLSGTPYAYGVTLNPGDRDFQTNVSARVIADHSRAITFLIADGVRPENLGRGYVLRRILRRAVRHGRKLGLDKPFLSEMIETVIATLKSAYPELADQATYVKSLVKAEEERFGETLGAGLAILNEAMEELKAAGKTVLAGSVAFKLYDTFGFPLDLVRDAAREQGLAVDEAGFDLAMGDQRAKGRAAWRAASFSSDAAQALVDELTGAGFKGEFLGYETLAVEGQIPALIVAEGRKVDSAGLGQEVSLVFPQTPFYGASGGQVGDEGRILFATGEVLVREAAKAPGGVIVHRGQVAQGSIALSPARLEVDPDSRKATAANHSATHLLHLALRQALGDHVRQAGSLVTAERLRFDFTHPTQVSDEDLARVEEMVNAEIIKNWPIETAILSYDEAVRSGAMALFEERYGDQVRVVSMGSSRELCGGTHAQKTGDIGFFVVAQESAVAAGVRRLECLTGLTALKEHQAGRARLKELAQILKARPEELADRVKKQAERIQELSRTARSQPTAFNPDSLWGQAEDLVGFPCLAAVVPAEDPKALRELADLLREKASGPAVIGLGAKGPGDKALLLVSVSPELADRWPAGRLIGPMAEAVGGRGGGKPLLAQAGGPQAAELPAALAAFKETVRKLAAGG